MRKRRVLVLIVVLAIGAWVAPKFVSLPLTVSEGYDPFGPPRSYPVSKVVKDDRPAFHIDADKPWRVDFGRGSGWHGLDTAALDGDGRVVFYRLKEERERDVLVHSWETTTARFPPDAVAKILEAIESNRLLELAKAYHADVADGTQWVLWVRQGDREKAVYFDNHFPDPIVRFAERFDAIIAESVGPSLKWRAVPLVRSRDHERELWDSIRG